MAAFLFSLLLLLLPQSHGEEVWRPLHLSDANFEHDTQAASGQTTGAWLVLFDGGNPSAEGKRADDALVELLKRLDGHPLVAKVNLSESPKISKRFSLTRPPYLKLFRDRRMFAYTGDWSAASIWEFVESGWKQTAGEDVPVEAGLGDELLEALRTKYLESRQFLADHPMALASLASGVALAAYAAASRMLKGGTRRRKKPAKRGGRKSH